jgi:hypothetical protein
VRPSRENQERAALRANICLDNLKEVLQTPPPPPEGPRPPDVFQWAGEAHHFGRRELQYNLVTALWGRESVENGELIDAVYGHDVDGKEGALRKLTLDLTETLNGWGLLFVVERVGGGYALRHFTSHSASR